MMLKAEWVAWVRKTLEDAQTKSLQGEQNDLFADGFYDGLVYALHVLDEAEEGQAEARA
jgi:hypothetical protein